MSSRPCESCLGKLGSKDPHSKCFSCLGPHHIPNTCDLCTGYRQTDKSSYTDRLRRLVVWRSQDTHLPPPTREQARVTWKQWSETTRFDHSCFLPDSDQQRLGAGRKESGKKSSSTPLVGPTTTSSAGLGHVAPTKPAILAVASVGSMAPPPFRGVSKVLR